MIENKLKQNERFKNIDFLRFILALIIMMFHSRRYFELSTLNHGNVGVDFFFIIAGFFLFINIKPSDTLTFVKKRFLRLVPMIWFLLLIVFISSLFISEIQFSFNNHLLRIFLLDTIGLSPLTTGKNTGLVVSWFVSVLFITSIFYFYINKLFEKKYLNLIIGLITLFSYITYYSNNGFATDGHTEVIYHLLPIGVLRGLGGIGIGYFISDLYKNTKLQTSTKLKTLLFSGLEIYLSIFLIYYILFSSKLPGHTGFSFILMFTILFYLFTLKQGFLSKVLDNDFCAKLGSYSYSMYIMHYFITCLLKVTLYPPIKDFIIQHNILCLIIQTIILTIVGILTYYLVERPMTKFLNNKFLKPGEQKTVHK